MRKIFAMVISALMLITLTACGSGSSGSASSSSSQKQATASTEQVQNKVADGNHKILITYFSKTGNTEKAAKEIQAIVGGDLVKIEPVKPYPDDYSTTTDIGKKEKADNARPEVKTKVANMADYDVVFVGYPIWWGTAPMAVFTFMEQYDFTGKTVIPFCTSGGSGIDGSMADMRQLIGKGTLVKGFNCNNESGIKDWLVNIGLAK